MAKIVSIANQKGGVGKTATASALANGLRHRGYKVLMIDADPQCNTTDAYRVINKQFTLYELMKREITTKDAIQSSPYGDIIACSDELTRADNIFLESGREYLLKEALEDIQTNYDYIIIDTLPGLGIMLLNALTSSNGVIIPLGADRDSLQGLEYLTKTINATRKYSNPNLKVYGLLVTMVDSNTILAKSVIERILPEIEKGLNTKTFESKIRQTIKVKEARASRIPLIEYSSNATATLDYDKFINEFIKIVRGR